MTEFRWMYALWLSRWCLTAALAVVILRRRFKPSVALAWLGLSYFVPELALVMFLLLGDHRLGRKRVRLYWRVIQGLRQEPRQSRRRARETKPLIEPALMPIVRQAERSTGMPVVGGNSVELLADNKTMIQRLVEDIDAAGSNAHLLYYIYEPDETGRRVADALIRAAQRGVACRLLADAAGSWAFFHSDLPARLVHHGVKVFPMLPVRPLRRGLARIDLRNHRKLAVIDGTIAFTGSQNIVNDTFGHRRAGSWVDMSGRFTGPIVTELQAVFVEDWAFDAEEVLEEDAVFPLPAPTGDVAAQAVPTGPSHETEALPRVLLAALNWAQHRIVITTPYLVPDEPMMLALAMAADRGVDVSVVVPQQNDHILVAAAGRSYFPWLMDSGIQIYRHTAGLLHAKTVTVDDAFALIGSANMDIRSFYLCFELNVLLYGRQVTEKLRQVQLRYIAESVPVDSASWRKRPFYKSYLENAASLLSPLL